MKSTSTRSVVAILAALTTIFSIFASYTTDEVLLDAVKDLVIFFTSVFFSYQIAIADANKVTEKRLQELGKATIQRIKILYNDIQTLAERVSGYESEDNITKERHSNAVDTLLRLQNAVKASFDEIKQTANLPLQDSDLYELPEFDTLPRRSQQLRVSVQKDQLVVAFSDQISCPKCKTISKVVVAHHAGATRHVDCENCAVGFTVHRRPDGNLFVGQSSLLVSREIQCLNTTCGLPVRFKHKNADDVVHRACANCFQNFEYDTKLAVAEKKAIKFFEITRSLVADQPISLQCTGCSYRISGTPYINNSGQNIMFCFNCGVPTVVKDGSVTHPSSAHL